MKHILALLALLAAGPAFANSACDRVTNDFDGDLRPTGSRSDAGADELTSIAPQIKKLSISGNHCVIDFTTLSGFTYDLVKSSDLTTAAWPIAVSNIPGNGAVVQATDTNGAGQPHHFYQVRRSL